MPDNELRVHQLIPRGVSLTLETQRRGVDIVAPEQDSIGIPGFVQRYLILMTRIRGHHVVQSERKQSLLSVRIRELGRSRRAQRASRP